MFVCDTSHIDNNGDKGDYFPSVGSKCVNQWVVFLVLGCEGQL